MVRGIVKILLYIIGFSLAAFAVIYTIALYSADLLAENSVKVALVGIAAIVLLLIARRMSEKHGRTTSRPACAELSGSGKD